MWHRVVWCRDTCCLHRQQSKTSHKAINLSTKSLGRPHNRRTLHFMVLYSYYYTVKHPNIPSIKWPPRILNISTQAKLAKTSSFHIVSKSHHSPTIQLLNNPVILFSLAISLHTTLTLYTPKIWRSPSPVPAIFSCPYVSKTTFRIKRIWKVFHCFVTHD
jgi:hypothetical protein